ncbi:hypothetical protein [uncultured Jannaschia sp.]|uniref:hypothetical protein n=1 Tax=uncultured Jannaschia sp. TaxID=293347 RepID=UPI0026070345|nr:hypothetical protein [uncultured Jannaschia sp.]
MTTSDWTRSTTVALAGTAAIAAFASFAPSTASAADYDMDCKLLLCLPGGFPSGCSDAFDHMMDRLRDGKSPIGFCAMSNGAEYDAYDMDYAFKSPATPAGWECPEGKHLYHRTTWDDDGHHQTVNTFCYDTAYARTGWDSDVGTTTVTTYTNKTAPQRADFWVNLTLEPDTPQAYSQGWQKFDTGRGVPVTVRYTD